MVAFIVAGFVFIGSVGAVLYASDEVGGPAVVDAPTAASLRLQAGSLVDLLLNSQGLVAPSYDFGGSTGTVGFPAGTDWIDGDVLLGQGQEIASRPHADAAAESLLRLGLADPDYPGYL